MTAAPLTVCAACGAPSLRRVPVLPAAVLIPGGTGSRTRHAVFVNGERRFRRRLVAKNADGSETVYSSLREAERGELERCASPMVARQNVRTLRRQGWVAGSRSAGQVEALEQRGLAASRDVVERGSA